MNLKLHNFISYITALRPLKLLLLVREAKNFLPVVHNTINASPEVIEKVAAGSMQRLLTDALDQSYRYYILACESGK